MRIGFEAKRLFLNDRGLGNYARNLVSGLIKYAPANEYLLLTPKQSTKLVSPDAISHPSVEVITPGGVLGALSKSAWRSLRLGRVAKANQVELLHGLAQELPMDIKKSGAKSVVTVHDMIFMKHPEFYKAIDRKIYYRKLRFATSAADKIIAISEQTKTDLLHYFKLPDEKIEVVYQSCNEIFYTQRSAAELALVKEKWNLPEAYLLYVGALNPNKNVLVILEAMQQLGASLELPLVVVGKGIEYKKKLVAYASKHGLLNRLIFASEIANPSPLELSSFYQMASAFIFPSHYEGFGIPLLEARFSGTPVIASNSSCLHEAGGKHTAYFNPNSAEELASMIADIDQLETKEPENFKLKTITSRLIELYAQVLNA